MDSITKNRVSPSAIAEMTRVAFNADPIEADEICSGFFNAVYKIKLDFGDTVILKIAPSDTVAVMRYEKELMKSEVIALNRISTFKFFPAPRVIFYDQSRRLIDSEYLFLQQMPGIPLSSVEKDLQAPESSELFAQAGIYAHKLNSITNDSFGSLSLPEKQFKTWSEAFYSMIDDLMLDAEDINAKLPCSRDYVRNMVKDEIGLFDKVKIPSLVHKDLWVGNILVDVANAEVTGIIDFERAIYADPLMEPVCALLDENKSFICTYNSGKKFNRNQYLRMAIYKIYLGLAGIIECEFRQYCDNSVRAFFEEKCKTGFEEYRLIKSGKL